MDELEDTDLVVRALGAMKEAVQSIAHFKDRAVFVYDEDDLSTKLKGLIKYPAVGIVYEGMRNVDPSRPGGASGSSVELIISLMVVNQLETNLVATADNRTPTLLYLTALRRKLLAQRSPAGHYWRFLVEAPAKPSKGLTFWVQRWSTPLQLQHNK